MYAVFSDGGRQYCAKEGEKLLIDWRDANVGDTFEFDQVLMIGGTGDQATLGKPTINGAKVLVTVLAQTHNKKIHVGVYKRRKNFRRHRGHRQPMTEISVTRIQGATSY